MPPPEGATAEGAEPQTEDETPAAPTVLDAIKKARENLRDKGTMFVAPEEEEKPEAKGEPEAEAEDEDKEVEEEVVEDETDEAEKPDDEPPADEKEAEEPEDASKGEVDEAEKEPEEVDKEAEDDKTFTARLPGRFPDDDDVEIEVDDQKTAERINQLRNGFMRGEEVRKATDELQAAQGELAKIDEAFTIDPAGFVNDHIDAKIAPQVALALLVQPNIWKELEGTINTLLQNPQELRTLQAEAKAARLETKQMLKDKMETRKRQDENSKQVEEAIDLIAPEDMEESTRQVLIRDMIRDVMEHISRNKLEELKVKDVPMIVAERLRVNGLDPLQAQEAIKNGKRSRGKPSLKKKPKVPPKTGKQLVKASAKRKKVAAAPGAGKKAAPIEPKRLPAGQTIKERFAEVRKRGGLGNILGNR